ncbi:MAG: hypothetical protein OXM62_07260 [bacterium]|nr:hypothetical protein [bacterium]
MSSKVALGQSGFRVVVVPARAAYLIRDDDPEAAVRAVQEASTRWAGFSEPIIPVSSSGSVPGWYRQVIEVSAVDGLVNVNLERDIADQLAGSIGLPWIELGEINEEGITQFSTHPACLRQQGRLVDHTASLSSTGGALWEKIAAGDLTPEAEDDSFGASVAGRRSTGGNELVLAQLYGTCWLDAGASQFREHIARGMMELMPMLIWVTRPDSLKDCLYYWNLRAIRALGSGRVPMMLVPFDPNTDWDTLRRVLPGSLARPEVLTPDVLLFSWSIEKEDLERIGEFLGLERTELPPRSSMVIPPPPPRSGPFTFRTDINPRMYLAVPRRYGETTRATVQVYRDDTIVEVDSPVTFSGQGRLLVRLSSSALDGIPRRPATASLIHKEASWFTDEFDDDALQVSSFARNRYKLNLRIPTLSEVTWSLLGEETVTAKLSDKGRLANRLDQVGVSDILLDSSVIEVIDYLKTPRSTSLLRALQQAQAEGSADEDLRELAAEWGGRAQRRSQPLRQIRGEIDPDAGSAVETLSSRSWAERGLRVRCDQCMIDSFIPIQTANPTPQCPACGATDQTYEPKGDPELHYRLNSMVDRAADQGIIPHLFAVAQLRASSSQTHILPGVELALSDHTSSEVDLYGVHEERVVAGEAKTKAEDFTEEQITRDIKLSTQLAADVHLMVCTEPIAETTRALAQEHANRAGIELKVIDRQPPSQDAT